ncbi:MAG: LD-carboxypeptidase [Myxococcales bacterium]|nr:LD-carboxypeptidase [Myxococcales bacterium]
MSAVVPRPVRPGDRVAIVAPSGPFPPVVVWRGLAFLRERYRLVFDRGLFARSAYLAGDDERRRSELARALEDDDIAAIIAARGGYGANRFVHELDWQKLRARPKWIVGFSDITALHVEAASVGVASIHASNVTALGWCDRAARASMIDALEDPLRSRRYEGLEVWVPGEAEGPLFGGNLAILQACAAAGRLEVPQGAVVFLEDVTEKPYRLDRMLTTLLVGGHLRGARAFVLGDFTDCGPGPDGATAHEVLRQLLAPLGVPVVAGLPAGHGRRNDPLVFGGRARLVAQPSGGVVEIGG